MKKAFFISGFAMVVALVAVVLVWLQLQSFWQNQQAVSLSADLSDNIEPTASATGELSSTSVAAETQAINEGTPLRDLSLTKEQQALVESFGFDVDTMIVNQTVIDCARETLGESRYQQILAGDILGVLEAARIVPCLGQ